MKIIATTRQAQGTGASRRLRRADKLPGIVYGGKKVPCFDLDDGIGRQGSARCFARVPNASVQTASHAHRLPTH